VIFSREERASKISCNREISDMKPVDAQRIANRIARLHAHQLPLRTSCTFVRCILVSASPVVAEEV
jgi:hypothetical protein